LPTTQADFSPGLHPGQRKLPCQTQPRRLAGPVLALALLFALIWMAGDPALAQPAQNPALASALPEAPQPQLPAQPSAKPPAPCPVSRGPGPAPAPTPSATGAPSESAAPPAPGLCTPIPVTNWFARFLNGPEVKPLTPAEKARLAARNVLDPFNAVTILGTSAFSVGLNPQSAYGPGMTGFGRYVGVSYAQDLTGEFFGTFLIPSIVHQDPHYHRLPNAPMKRRIEHALYQVVWTQGDNGKEMVNYANLAGFAIDDEIGNLYVPGRQTDAPATASRYAIGLATAPIDNFVTEFLPDVARHIHIRVVLIQRIINQVAKTGGPGSP